MKGSVEILQRHQVRRDIVANCRVRTATGFNSPDALRLQSAMAHEELAVFTSENIVGDSRDPELIAQSKTELQHERRFAAADRPTNADRECTLIEVAAQRGFALMEAAGVIAMLVRVRVTGVTVM